MTFLDPGWKRIETRHDENVETGFVTLETRSSRASAPFVTSLGIISTTWNFLKAELSKKINKTRIILATLLAKSCCKAILFL